MIENLEQTHVLGLAVVVAAGLAFAGGYVLGGSAGDMATPTGDVTAADTATVEEDVLNYLETITGGQVNITIDSVQKADIGDLYKVDVTVSAETPQGTQEQQASVYTTLDGEYIFPAEPEDLQNPPQPQMQMQPQPPEDGAAPEQ